MISTMLMMDVIFYRPVPFFYSANMHESDRDVLPASPIHRIGDGEPFQHGARVS